MHHGGVCPLVCACICRVVNLIGIFCFNISLSRLCSLFFSIRTLSTNRSVKISANLLNFGVGCMKKTKKKMCALVTKTLSLTQLHFHLNNEVFFLFVCHLSPSRNFQKKEKREKKPQNNCF